MKFWKKFQKSIKRPAVLITALLAVGLALGWALLLRQDKELTPTSSNSDAPSTIANDPTSGGNITKNILPPPPSTNPSSDSSSGISMEISQSFQDDNSDLVVQTSIKGTSSGLCKLSLSQGSSTINKSAEVLYQPSFSTCRGFTIPIGEIPSSGTWQLKIVLEVGGKQVASTTKEVVVKK